MIRQIYLVITLCAAMTTSAATENYLKHQLPLIAYSNDIFIDEEDTTDQIDKAMITRADSDDPAQDSIWKSMENSGQIIHQGNKIKKPWPTGALLLSAAIPGGGQFYNKKYIKTILYGGTEAYLIWYVRWRWKQMDKHWQNVVNTEDDEIKAREFPLYEKRRDSRNVHLWLTALVVFVSMFDAYVDAHLADFDQTDKAFEVFLTPEDDRIKLNLAYNF